MHPSVVYTHTPLHPPTPHCCCCTMKSRSTTRERGKKNKQKNKLKIQLEIAALKYCQRCSRVQMLKVGHFPPLSVGHFGAPFPQLIHGAFKGSFRSDSSSRNTSKLVLLLLLLPPLLLLVQMKRGITSVTSTGNYVNLSVSPCCCLPPSHSLCIFSCLPRVCSAFFCRS